MNLKDYLHYYLYGKIYEVGVSVCQLLAIGTVYYTIKTRQGTELTLSDRANVKLVLRKLDDLTEDEIRKVAVLAFGDEDFIITYKGMGYDIDGHIIHDSVKCFRIETYCEHPHVKDWLPAALLQIDIEDKDMPITIGRFSDNGKYLADDLIAKPFELTHYLLSRGFDLFGLIGSGLAIDAKTLTP
jgi:hypothetical protein